MPLPSGQLQKPLDLLNSTSCLLLYSLDLRCHFRSWCSHNILRGSHLQGWLSWNTWLWVSRSAKIGRLSWFAPAYRRKASNETPKSCSSFHFIYSKVKGFSLRPMLSKYVAWQLPASRVGVFSWVLVLLYILLFSILKNYVDAVPFKYTFMIRQQVWESSFTKILGRWNDLI